MKKVFSVLTVAVLAVSTVFAGFSGSASIGVGANFDNGNFGFLNQSQGVVLDAELSTANGEAVGEGDVYASIKGSMELAYLGDKPATADHKPANQFGFFGINAAITEAKVGGENWSVSILGLPWNPDYAKSALDAEITWEKDAWGRGTGAKTAVAYDYKAPYAKTSGVAVNVMDYKASLGFLGDYSKADNKVNYNLTATFETPEYNLNGFTVKAGTSYAYNNVKWNDDHDNIIPVDAGKNVNGLGVSAKVGYANDVLSASLATDMGVDFLETTKDEDRFNADVAANFTYDFVAVDAYYATKATSFYKGSELGAKEDLLSAQVAVDLNSFNVPVAIAVSGADLINSQDLVLAVDVTPIEGLTVSAYGEYVIDSKDWGTGASAEYKTDAFTVKGGVDVANAPEKVMLMANVSAETEALIPGAKLAVGWAANDLLNVVDDVNVDGGVNYGSLTASCTIKF